jgi:hypothetical protein
LAEEQAALRVATLVAEATPPQVVFAAVAEEVGRLLAVDFAILVRQDPQGTLETVGSWTRTGAPPPIPVGGRLPLGGRNVTTMVYRTGRPARQPGRNKGPRAPLWNSPELRAARGPTSCRNALQSTGFRGATPGQPAGAS